MAGLILLLFFAYAVVAIVAVLAAALALLVALPATILLYAWVGDRVARRLAPTDAEEWEVACVSFWCFVIVYCVLSYSLVSCVMYFYGYPLVHVWNKCCCSRVFRGMY